MVLKKILLLGSMALAALAFAMPAVAQAEVEWVTEETEEPIEGEVPVEMSGALTGELAGGALKVGPSETHWGGYLANGEGEEEAGTVVEGTATGESATNLPGCKSTITYLNQPWALTKAAPDLITYHGVTIMWHFSAGCSPFGIPSTVRDQGKLTGTLKNIGGQICTVLNKSGDLEDEFTGQAMTYTGTLCSPGLTFR